MFHTTVNKDTGVTTIKCAITDREHIFRTSEAGSKKRVAEIAEQMQRKALYDTLGFDPNKQQPLEVYREAWAKYQRGLGR